MALLKSLGSLLKGLWPFILIAIFSGNDEEEKKSVFLFSVLAAVAVLLLVSSLVNFFFFRFYIQEDELIIKKGWLKKVVLTVPLQKIQAVHIEQGPLHQLLNIVKLSADTAGSSKTEVTIQALRKPMAEALRERYAWEHVTVVRNTFPLAEGTRPTRPEAPRELVYAGRLAAYRELEVIAEATRAPGLPLPVTLVGPADETWLASFDAGAVISGGS